MQLPLPYFNLNETRGEEVQVSSTLMSACSRFILPCSFDLYMASLCLQWQLAPLLSVSWLWLLEGKTLLPQLVSFISGRSNTS